MFCGTAPPLSLAKQATLLLGMHPGFRCIRRGRRYVWRGSIQPTLASDVYTVRIEYEMKKSPAVFVESPTLVPRQGEERVRHRYSDGRLCLYLPAAGEWRPHLPVANSIIPWTSLWLYHYEVWHATGKWLGGGHEPEQNTETTNEENTSKA